MPNESATGPASKGIVMPAQVMATKLAAFALSRFSRPATSSTSVMRDGSLTAISTPSARATARICQSSMRSDSTSSATAAISAACTVCAPTNSQRRSQPVGHHAREPAAQHHAKPGHAGRGADPERGVRDLEREPAVRQDVHGNAQVAEQAGYPKQAEPGIVDE